jgi:heme/copper-type cytochrome/quinol oxidase subunit 2
MQHALGLLGDQAFMFGITVALGIAGIAALFMALFWPRRWHLKYRVEVVFVALLAVLAVYADVDSANTYQAYESQIPARAMAGETHQVRSDDADFDRHVRVLTFQWGFVFLDEQGRASRNAVRVGTGQKVLLSIMSNDVIHGLNIPVARLTTELEPGEVRQVWIRTPDQPGKYLMQCLNYCGLGHAQMKAWLVVGTETGSAGAQSHG